MGKMALEFHLFRLLNRNFRKYKSILEDVSHLCAFVFFTAMSPCAVVLPSPNTLGAQNQWGKFCGTAPRI